MVEPRYVLLRVPLFQSLNTHRPARMGVREHAPRDGRRLPDRSDYRGRRLYRRAELLLPVREVQTLSIEGNTMTCQYCTLTETRWRKYSACSVAHCANLQLMLSDPPIWAVGGTRKATSDDTISGMIIENANYICVRSCFCRREKCPHYTHQTSSPRQSQQSN